jgi:hypothetical protein
MNYRKLTDRLIVGAVPEQNEDVVMLEDLGVTGVINCIEEPANLRSKWTELQCHLPQHDDGTKRDPALFAKGVQFFRNTPGVIYVHCWEGRRRGPTTAYAILRSTGMHADDAFTLVSPPKSYRDDVEEFIEKRLLW